VKKNLFAEAGGGFKGGGVTSRLRPRWPTDRRRRDIPDRSTVKHALQNTQNDCHQWLSHRFRVHQIRFRMNVGTGVDKGGPGGPAPPNERGVPQSVSGVAGERLVVVVVGAHPAEAGFVADTATQVVADETKPIGRHQRPNQPHQTTVDRSRTASGID